MANLYYRIAGDEQKQGIGSSPYPEIGERLTEVFATPSFKTAQQIIAVLNGHQMSADGGCSWAHIFIIRATTAVLIPPKSGCRLDCDHDQHLVTGQVVGVLKNNGKWSY